MKPILLHKHTLWFLIGIATLTPIIWSTKKSHANNEWYPKNPQLQNLFDGCKQLENLSFILKTLVDGTHFDKTLKKSGSAFFGLLMNTSNLGMRSIRVLEHDLEKLQQHYACVVQPDHELRAQAESSNPEKLTCANIQCLSKQSCIGATVGETAHFLTPLVHSMLGKVIDTTPKDGNESDSYQIEAGMLMNMNTLAYEALALAEKTNLAQLLGSSGEQLISSLKKNIERLQVVTNALTVASNDILFALETAAPLIGGKEYIESLPMLTEADRSKLLAEQIEVDLDALEELTMDDFLL